MRATSGTGFTSRRYSAGFGASATLSPPEIAARQKTRAITDRGAIRDRVNRAGSLGHFGGEFRREIPCPTHNEGMPRPPADATPELFSFFIHPKRHLSA